MPLVPALPGASTQDKRVQISALERVDLNDFNDFTALERAALAHTLWAAVDGNDRVIAGLRVVSNNVQSGGADNMTVWVQTGRGLQAGYLMKLLAAAQLSVPANATGGVRTDRVGIRYVEDNSDNAARRRITAIVRTAVTNASIGTGDGVTRLFTTANSGIDGRTFIVKVAGVIEAATLVPGTGAGGVDQIAFDDPPAAGAVTATYTWQQGGVEESANVNTRFAATVETQYKAGAALDAGFVELATIAVPNGAVSVGQTIITDTRTFVFSGEGVRLTDWTANFPKYHRFGSDVGIETAAGYDTVANLRFAVNRVIINGVPVVVDQGSGTAESTLLEDGAAYTANTWYYAYICLLRNTSTPTTTLVVAAKAQDGLGRLGVGQTITKTVSGTQHVFPAADCLYVGALYRGATKFHKQRRVGTAVMYAMDTALIISTADETILPQTYNLSPNGTSANAPVFSKGVYVSTRIKNIHATTITQINVGSVPAAGDTGTINGGFSVHANPGQQNTVWGFVPFTNGEQLRIQFAGTPADFDHESILHGYEDPLR